MSARHHCPISVCGWWFDEVTVERPATDLPQRIPGLAIAQESHYACHTRADWAAEAERRGLPGAIENAADFLAAFNGFTAGRIPPRAEVEAGVVHPHPEEAAA